jgi:lambda repressor-like predicted transcriptional regulator
MDEKRLAARHARGKALRQKAADAEVRGKALHASVQRAWARATKLRAIPIKPGRPA